MHLTNNFESDFMRVWDFCFSVSPSLYSGFQRNANKIDFILKSVHFEILAQKHYNLYKYRFYAG